MDTPELYGNVKIESCTTSDDGASSRMGFIILVDQQKLVKKEEPEDQGMGDRAIHTLPPSLEVQKSDIPDAGLGVFNMGETISLGAHFGPCEGDLVDREEALNSAYSWVEKTLSAMPPKGKGKRKKTGRREQSVEPVPSTAAAESEGKTATVAERLRGESGDSDSGQSAVTGTGKRTIVTSYSFPAETEQRLVDFYEANPCFYDKGQDKYADSHYKERLLSELSREIKTEASKISGWFNTQRTAVGKLFKRKSEQAAQTFTSRQKWQLAKFSFLRQHILPRTYTQDTAKFSGAPEGDGDEESGAEEFEVGSSVSVQGDTQPQASSRGVKRGRAQPSKLNDALLKLLTRPRESESLAKRLQMLDQPTDDRVAFGNWILSRLHRVPAEKWDDFQDEAFALVTRYTRQRPAHVSTNTSPASSALISWSSSQQWPQQPQQQQQQLWSYFQTRQLPPSQAAPIVTMQRSVSVQPLPQPTQQDPQKSPKSLSTPVATSDLDSEMPSCPSGSFMGMLASTSQTSQPLTTPTLSPSSSDDDHHSVVSSV